MLWFNCALELFNLWLYVTQHYYMTIKTQIDLSVNKTSNITSFFFIILVLQPAWSIPEHVSISVSDVIKREHIVMQIVHRPPKSLCFWVTQTKTEGSEMVYLIPDSVCLRMSNICPAEKQPPKCGAQIRIRTDFLWQKTNRGDAGRPGVRMRNQWWSSSGCRRLWLRLSLYSFFHTGISFHLHSSAVYLLWSCKGAISPPYWAFTKHYSSTVKKAPLLDSHSTVGQSKGITEVVKNG